MKLATVPLVAEMSKQMAKHCPVLLATGDSGWCYPKTASFQAYHVRDMRIHELPWLSPLSIATELRTGEEMWFSKWPIFYQFGQNVNEIKSEQNLPVLPFSFFGFSVLQLNLW